MKGDESLEEHIARLLQDPGFAAEWAIQRPSSNFSLNVWAVRETKGFTQKQLAHSAKMKQPRIAEIERGDGNPTLLTISRIAAALGVPADRLLAEPDEAVLAEARSAVAARVATWPLKRRRALGLLDEDEQQQESAKPTRRRKTA
jgi:transcriptional regulator with XRE-family HTH domain